MLLAETHVRRGRDLLALPLPALGAVDPAAQLYRRLHTGTAKGAAHSDRAMISPSANHRSHPSDEPTRIGFGL